jgi:YgiT-type zinc finger domain-containing protein
MVCHFCNGSMKDEVTSDFTDLGTCMVIIKHVPCLTCDQCGETAFTGTVVKQLDKIINDLKESLTEVAIVQYSNNVA